MRSSAHAFLAIAICGALTGSCGPSAEKAADARSREADTTETIGETDDASVAATAATGIGGSEADEGEDAPEAPATAIEYWPRPKMDELRYVRVVDQAGCRWWTTLVPGSDDEAPYPELTSKAPVHPICVDRRQEPDGELRHVTSSEAARLFAARSARPAPKALLDKAEKLRVEDEAKHAEASRQADNEREKADEQRHRRQRNEDDRRRRQQTFSSIAGAWPAIRRPFHP